MMKRMWFLPAAFLFLLTSCKPAHQNPTESKPNILLLISDDQSADDLGIVGKGRPHTPALDALAASGVRFINAYASSPQCSPSRAALITGRSSHATGTSRLHSTLTSEHETADRSFAAFWILCWRFPKSSSWGKFSITLEFLWWR